MMPTIRVDNDVYRWLQSRARPFEDSPNSVLRRIAGIDPGEQSPEPDDKRPRNDPPPSSAQSSGRITGKRLNEEWHVGASHALYHEGGTFYENLKNFPGALFDPHGYVLFKTESEYNSSPHLLIGQKLNVPRGIATLPGYKRVR